MNGIDAPDVALCNDYVELALLARPCGRLALLVGESDAAAWRARLNPHRHTLYVIWNGDYATTPKTLFELSQTLVFSATRMPESSEEPIEHTALARSAPFVADCEPLWRLLSTQSLADCWIEQPAGAPAHLIALIEDVPGSSDLLRSVFSR